MPLQNGLYPKWPKIPRWNREVVITEKIDGTNAQIYIAYEGEAEEGGLSKEQTLGRSRNGFTIHAGSRKRWLDVHSDNYGFAHWVKDNADILFRLGAGPHYGEWWGKGIQRGYGVEEKRLSLFNPYRYNDGQLIVCGTTPIVYEGNLHYGEAIRIALDKLREGGSLVAPGFSRPEGIVVFHTQSRQLYKVLLENDDIPKGKTI